MPESKLGLSLYEKYHEMFITVCSPGQTMDQGFKKKKKRPRSIQAARAKVCKTHAKSSHSKVCKTYAKSSATQINFN